MNSADNVNSVKPLIITTLGLVSFTILSGLALSSTVASAEDIVDEINITVPVSCTMSGSGETSHNAEILNGHYDSNIGETTMKAYCNDGNGFAIYAIGYTDDTDGKNVLTSSTLGSEHDIVTGTNTGPVGNEDTSQWAMKLSTITIPTPTYPIIIAGSTDDTTREQGDPDYSSFQEVPNDYTLVAKRTSGTDINPSNQQTAEGSTLKTTYQAYISRTQVAGTYTGQVKYTLVHPHTAEAPGQVLIMQNVSEWGSTIQSGQEVIAMDSRDNKTYTVAKLADGNLWMTQNLDHDIKTDGSVIYDNTTTDLGWNTMTNSYDTASWMPIHSAYTHDSTSEYAWGNYGSEFENLYPEEYPAFYINVTYPESFNPGDLYWTGEISDNLSDYNSADFVSSDGDPHYHLGNYYSYPAAIAMNYYDDYSSSETIIEQSICPSGWTLPRAGNIDWGNLENDYLNLIQSYDSSFVGYGTSSINLFDAPTYFVLGGRNESFNKIDNVGISAFYLSSVNVLGPDYQYIVNSLHFDGHNISSHEVYEEGNGFIRCIAR